MLLLLPEAHRPGEIEDLPGKATCRQGLLEKWSAEGQDFLFFLTSEVQTTASCSLPGKPWNAVTSTVCTPGRPLFAPYFSSLANMNEVRAPRIAGHSVAHFHLHRDRCRDSGLVELEATPMHLHRLDLEMTDVVTELESMCLRNSLTWVAFETAFDKSYLAMSIASQTFREPLNRFPLVPFQTEQKMGDYPTTRNVAGKQQGVHQHRRGHSGHRLLGGTARQGLTECRGAFSAFDTPFWAWFKFEAKKRLPNYAIGPEMTMASGNSDSRRWIHLEPWDSVNRHQNGSPYLIHFLRVLRRESAFALKSILWLDQRKRPV